MNTTTRTLPDGRTLHAYPLTFGRGRPADPRPDPATARLDAELLLDLVERVAGRRLRQIPDRLALREGTRAQAAADVGVSESRVSRIVGEQVPRLREALAGRA